MAEETFNKETTESSTGQTYDGKGAYEPFLGETGSGSIYVPPAEFDPFFVPPSYLNAEFGTIKVHLFAQEPAEFFEDEKTLGTFQANKLEYSPSTTFGNRKIYKAKIANRISLNYYEVVIDKVYKKSKEVKDNALQNDNAIKLNQKNELLDLNFDFSNDSQGAKKKDDLAYRETIKVLEYQLDPATKGYELISERNAHNVNGTVNLEFKFASEIKVDGIKIINIDPLGDPLINYDITFLSNFKPELGESLTLEYDVVGQQDAKLDKGKVPLKHGKSDKKQIKQSFIDNGAVKFYVAGDIPTEYTFTHIYWANKQTALTHPDDYSLWNEVNRSFTLPSKKLAGGIVVIALLEKEVELDRPVVKVKSDYFDVEVRESDKEKGTAIQFTTENADYVNVYLSPTKFIKVQASVGYVDLYWVKDFNGDFGVKKIIFVPVSEQYGTGDAKEVLVKFLSVNDFPSITQIAYPEVIEIPSFSDLQIDYDVEYSSFAVTSVDVDLIDKNKKRIPLFKNLPANGKFRINLKTLAEKYPDWNGKTTVDLIFKPYNRSGQKELIGNEYQVVTKLDFPTIHLDEDTIRKTLYDAFDKYLDKLTLEEPEKESKYLTHLANFGNDDEFLISTWEEDNYTLSEKEVDDIGNEKITKEVKSLLIKLYEPLPTGFDKNTTFWITKLVTNSIIETVILSQDQDISCPPIKGPNFNVDVDYVTGQSTNFESLDNLILSASVSSSEQLVRTYISASTYGLENLSIDYASGSEYLWNNFVHFSSATERVNNFVYKVQLIQNYESLILSASTDIANPSASMGYPSAYTSSLSTIQDVERNLTKKNKIVQSFDGFEMFLYTSSSFSSENSSSLTWPVTGSNLLPAGDQTVSNWYTRIISKANDWDKENTNYIINNIPAYIKDYEENDHFVLFLSMIGQYFDIFYFYTKAIENSRGLGYKYTGQISTQLLGDILKSWSWETKNLSVDSKLWKYAFGLNDDGQLVEANPAKKRTYEVWRRIINNLPYLLKHRGTRRGIYALMSCYGIPASNLSIFEFGGPDVEGGLNKSKLEIDTTTYSVRLNSGSYIEVDWNNTDLNRKPDTIELFVKPTIAGNYTLISGSGWGLSLNSSVNSYYGNVVFNFKEGDGSSEILSSSIIPIFNNKPFGISLSRKIGTLTTFELNTYQAEKELFVFKDQSVITADGSNWESGSLISIAGNYSGSLDEFRLWSIPLNSASFEDHILFPEMINGNDISSSTKDLVFRLDFEYPKNLGLANPSRLVNVATNIRYSGSLSRNEYEEGSTADIYSSNPSASFYAYSYGFENKTEYPYNFEPWERTSIMPIPDGIGSRYATNKIRFEEQTLVSDLSSKYRATKKAYDTAPMDSNRIGIFFSPTKELNLDIAKSLGDINIGEYIGDPSSKYEYEYKELNKLRNYYFQRFQKRDIFSYINLVVLYEKALFEDIKQMLPARVKPTTGILIEPHFLERNKIKLIKPEGTFTSGKIAGQKEEFTGEIPNPILITSQKDDYSLEINATKTIIPTSENKTHETTIIPDIVLSSENPEYKTRKVVNDDINLSGATDDISVTLDTNVSKPHVLERFDQFIETVGMDDFDTWGFGLYAESGGYAIQTYIDKDRTVKQKRVIVTLVKEGKYKTITKYRLTSSVDGLGVEGGGLITTSSYYIDKKLVIQPFSGSTKPVVTGSIVSVEDVVGYLPTHHKFVKDAGSGLDNSKFRGSKQTSKTTIDGADPVEVFATNPNTLVVNKAGRTSSEPILEVE